MDHRSAEASSRDLYTDTPPASLAKKIHGQCQWDGGVTPAMAGFSADSLAGARRCNSHPGREQRIGDDSINLRDLVRYIFKK